MDLTPLRELAAALAADWRAAGDGLFFASRDAPLLAAAVLAASGVDRACGADAAGAPHRPRRGDVPAMLAGRRGSRLAWVRHTPLVVAGAGLPLALLALADPYTALVSQTVSYPGRRIALMIDASDSMQTSFKAATLNTRAASRAGVLHDGGGRAALRRAAAQGQVPRPDGARRVRQTAPT